MRKIILAVVALVFCVILIVGFLRRGDDRREGTFFAMGGIPFRVVAYDRERKQFNEDLRDVESAVDDLENVFSRYRNDSELARLNKMGEGCMEASPTLTALLKRARYWYDMSDGALDVTIGPLVDLWKQAGKEGRLPTKEEIGSAKSRVRMKYVEITDSRICLNRAGMNLDLGAIAKGAILDAAAELLKKSGVERGLVDAGGDVSSFGKDIFTIGIQDPRKEHKQELLGTITVPAGGVVTSGDYERFVIIEGKKYSHIVDPRTGYPAEGLVSVTVIGPNATDADALATALSVMGKEEGIKLLNQLDDYHAVMVNKKSDDTLDVWCSEDICPLLRLAN